MYGDCRHIPKVGDLVNYKDELMVIVYIETLSILGDHIAYLLNKELMEKADIATPHIAGYSYEGKVDGTVMSVRALAGFYDIAPLKTFTIEPPEKNTNSFSKDGLCQTQIAEYFGNIFPIFEHCADLKAHPQNFEQLRSNFKYRREFYVI